MASHDKPVIVTTAGRSLTEDRELRQRRYMYTQLVRLCCFVLAVALPVPLGIKLSLVVGAFVLPWFGVVAANAGPALQKSHRPSAIVDRGSVEPQPVALDPTRTIEHD